MLGLLLLGSTRHQPPLVEAAFRLTVLVLASGAAAGAVYDATRGLRQRTGLARAMSWWLVAGAAAALLLVAIRVFLVPLLAPGSGDAQYALRLTGPTGMKVLGVAVLAFGWAMADVTADVPSQEPRARVRGPGHTLTIFASVLVVWAVSSMVGNPPPARVLPENAVEARRVIADAERDAREHPDDGQAQFAYGLSLMQLDRYAEAAPVLARAERMLPDQAWPASALGWVLIQQKDYAAALPHIRRAVKLDPQYGAAYHNLGWALWKLGHLEEAEAAYSEAVKLELREPGLAADYAWVLFQDRKTSRAIAQIYRAIRLDSSEARYHGAAGYFLRSQSRFPEARAEFHRAVELNPSLAVNWVQLAVTDYLMGDTRGADTAFAAAAKRDTMVARNTELRAMWEAARKGRSVTVHIEPRKEFHFDSSTTPGH